MSNYSIGSCYIVKQLPGAERMGGVEVLICPKRGDLAAFNVERTEWRTGEAFPDLEDIHVEAAVAGIKSIASEVGFPLDEFDVIIRRFIDHPIDWNPKCVFQAGRSAFRAAMEGFQVADI